MRQEKEETSKKEETEEGTGEHIGCVPSVPLCASLRVLKGAFKLNASALLLAIFTRPRSPGQQQPVRGVVKSRYE